MDNLDDIVLVEISPLVELIVSTVVVNVEKSVTVSISVVFSDGIDVLGSGGFCGHPTTRIPLEFE